MIYLCDAFNTLLDMTPIDVHWVQAYARWFKSPKTRYMPMDAMLRCILDAMINARDSHEDENQRRALCDAWNKLRFHPDVPIGLNRLRAAGHEVYIMSNANTAFMERIIATNVAGALIKVLPAVEEVKRFKPHPDVYDWAINHFPGKELTMVAAHIFDIDAARSRGMKTAYFPRGRFDNTNTHRVITNLCDLS